MGREEQIIANCVDKGRMINLWMEYQTSIDTYNNQLTLKYPDTDTIYCYDDATNDLLSQYVICTREEKGDYEVTWRILPSSFRRRASRMTGPLNIS